MKSSAIKHIQKITDVAKDLPDGSLQELLDFAEFLRMKKKGFSYGQVADSAEYVRSIRAEWGRKTKSGEQLMKELMEWQESSS